MNKKWVPREVNKLQSTDDFMERLNRWIKEPESDPELEKWYKYSYPEGLPFEVKKQAEWEVDHDTYFPMYEEALRLKQSDQEERALEIFLEIHERFIPRGTTYYDDTIWLLEKRGQFDKAIEVCEKAINAISKKVFSADIELYKNDILRLANKQSKKLSADEAE